MLLLQVIGFTFLASLATGLGALPFVWFPNLGKAWIGRCNALAAGAMLGASIILLKEGWVIQPSGLIVGLIAGAFFISTVKRALKKRPKLSITSIKGVNGRRALLIIAIMTLHSFAEGVGMGVSFSQGIAFGLLITLALAIHNIPEGLAVSVTLVPKKTSVARAAMWSIFSSLPQMITAVPAFLFVQQFQPFVAPGIGFAAGAMIWMCIDELLPEAVSGTGMATTSLYTTGATLLMIILERLIP